MKNFDTTRNRAVGSVEERTFTIGGESLVALGTLVRPEVYVDQLARITNESSVKGDLEALDALVLALLEPESHELWKALRARETDPILQDDIMEVSKWLVEQQTGRPTGEPSGSSSGLNGTATKSTEGSSSQDIPAALAV